MTNQDPKIHSIFPTHMYSVKRDSNLTPIEEKEIRKIIKEGMNKNPGNSSSANSYIFNEKLKKIKQFCEQHIKIYVEKIITPKEELDFYITQSWLNVTEPGGSHHQHYHPNSIISGVFYLSSVEDDKINFLDPNHNLKERYSFSSTEYNVWNSRTWFVSVENNILVLFPSWLEHSVEPNEKATKNRISLSFNVFAKGIFGGKDAVNELIL